MDKTKAEIILELVISLNKDSSTYKLNNVEIAIKQYEELVKKGVLESEY